MARTYIAVLVDDPNTEAPGSYPGVTYRDEGTPMSRVRLRREAEGGALRVSDYLLVGPGDDDEHYLYRFEAEGPWDSASRADEDWIIDADPSTLG